MESASCVNYEHKHNDKELIPFEEWANIFADCNPSSVFIGGTFALLPAIDLEDYIKFQKPTENVSVFFILNCTGNNKKELAVFGKQKLDDVGSLPLKYYYCGNSKVTVQAIKDYLSKLNDDLAAEGDNIKLLLKLPPDVTEQLIFSNIVIVKSSIVVRATEKVVKSFKYHYRKLQIIKNIVSGENAKKIAPIDYLNMISAAWHNISKEFLMSIFYQLGTDSRVDENEAKLSLSSWCISYNVPLDTQSNPKVLDDFISCDDTLSSLQLDNNESITVEETIFCKGNSTSEIEAYQAMKRLVSYLQSENACPETIRSAKTLEDHLECGAISEIHQFFME